MSSIAHELITRGWIQGTFAGGQGGPSDPVCLQGAARCAAFGSPRLFDLADEDERRHRALAYEYIVEEVLAKRLGERHVWAWVPEWQDAEDRTFDEVLSVAKEADEVIDGLDTLPTPQEIHEGRHARLRFHLIGAEEF
jgi:hypothetical protein